MYHSFLACARQRCWCAESSHRDSRVSTTRNSSDRATGIGIYRILRLVVTGGNTYQRSPFSGSKERPSTLTRSLHLHLYGSTHTSPHPSASSGSGPTCYSDSLFSSAYQLFRSCKQQRHRPPLFSSPLTE